MSLLKIANALSELDEKRLAELHDQHDRKHLLYENLKQKQQIDELNYSHKKRTDATTGGSALGGLFGANIAGPLGAGLGSFTSGILANKLVKPKYKASQEDMNRLNAAELERDLAELKLLEYMDEKGLDWPS